MPGRARLGRSAETFQPADDRAAALIATAVYDALIAGDDAQTIPAKVADIIADRHPHADNLPSLLAHVALTLAEVSVGLGQVASDAGCVQDDARYGRQFDRREYEATPAKVLGSVLSAARRLRDADSAAAPKYAGFGPSAPLAILGQGEWRREVRP